MRKFVRDLSDLILDLKIILMPFGLGVGDVVGGFVVIVAILLILILITL
jgi:hypothetical protein